MGESMVDVTIHIDESLDKDRRDALREKMIRQRGVMAAVYRDNKPHLMLVEYDPDTTKSTDLLNAVTSEGVHAELVGL